MGLVASVAGTGQEKCVSAGFALFIFKGRRSAEAAGRGSQLAPCSGFHHSSRETIRKGFRIAD